MYAKTTATMWPTALAVSLVLAGQVSAGAFGDVESLARRDSSNDNVRRYAESLVDDVERRTTSAIPSSINMTEWDAQTSSACMTSLTALNGVASNPSGMAVCYNLPFLDNSTGVFQADLRLYRVADPNGDFAGIQSQDVQVGLSYLGASVSAANTSTVSARDAPFSMLSWPIERRDEAEELGRRQSTNSTPVMVQSYAFVGQVNKNLMTATMNVYVVPPDLYHQRRRLTATEPNSKASWSRPSTSQLSTPPAPKSPPPSPPPKRPSSPASSLIKAKPQPPAPRQPLPQPQPSPRQSLSSCPARISSSSPSAPSSRAFGPFWALRRSRMGRLVV